MSLLSGKVVVITFVGIYGCDKGAAFVGGSGQGVSVSCSLYLGMLYTSLRICQHCHYFKGWSSSGGSAGQ